MDVLSAMAVFVRVIERQSFSLAAGDLGVSSSSVSKQVSHLEAHVGATLLERTTRRLSVTEAGAAYYEKCQQILSQVEQAEALVTDLQGGAAGLLRVNCDITFGSLLLPRMISEFSARYPDIQLEVFLDDGAARGIKEGFHLSLSIGDRVSADETLDIRELVSVPQVPCATPEYIALHGEPQTPQELDAHNCLLKVSSRDDSNWLLSNSEANYSIQPRWNLKAYNELVVTEAMLRHQGIAMIAGFEAERLIREGRIVLLLTDYNIEPRFLYAICPKRECINTKTDLFVEFVEGWMAENL